VIRHVVLFRWNDDVDQRHVDEVAAALDELRRDIVEIAAYHHGPDIGLNPGAYDYAVVADFVSRDDYLAYRDHRLHQAFVERLITGRVADRAAAQFEL
jgi:hypothetical protein